MKISCFGLGNSPAEMKEEKIRVKRIVFTSTNFSRALAASMKSPAIVIGSMLNLSAVTGFAYKKAKENGYGIYFMLAGNEDNNADEDLAFAGAAGNLLKKFRDIHIGSEVENAIDFVNKKGTESCIKESNHAKRLVNSGFFDDVEFACRRDIFDIVLGLKGEKSINLSGIN